MFRFSVTNTTGTANRWLDSGTIANSIAANTKVVRYVVPATDGDAVGLTNANLQISGFGVADICSGSLTVDPSNIRDGFVVSCDVLVGDREITIFDHTGS